MAKGKYKARANNRRVAEAETTVESLREELAEVIADRDRIRTELAQIPRLEKALEKAKNQRDKVTTPRIRELESQLTELQATVDDIDRTRSYRDEFVKLALEGLKATQNMTHFEAVEKLGQMVQDNITLVEGDHQKRLGKKSPEALRTLQRIQGLRS